MRDIPITELTRYFSTQLDDVRVCEFNNFSALDICKMSMSRAAARKIVITLLGGSEKYLIDKAPVDQMF